MTLRLCCTKTDLLKWIRDPTKAAGGQFKGGLSGLINYYVSFILKVTPNVTVQAERFSFDGQQHRKGHAGCLRRLQQNQSDLIATESLYPTIGENVTNGPVIYADKTAFLSSYSNELLLRNADIMQSFGAFSVTVWFMTILSTLLIMLMISYSKVLTQSQKMAIRKQAKQKRLFEQQEIKTEGLRSNSAPVKMTKKKKNRHGNHLVRSLGLSYYSFIKRSTRRTSCSSLSVATLTLMLIILSFYVSFFFIAIVKTEKVVMTKPPTIESYEDIINSYPDKKTAFILNLNSHLPFAEADEGSREWRIWQDARRAGLNRTLVRDLAVELFVKSEIIYIAPSLYVKYMACAYCRLRNQLELTPIPMAKSDESAKENIFVFLLSGHLPSAIAARFKQVFGRLLPSGFMPSALSQAIHVKRLTYEDNDVCLSNVVRFPDQYFSGISLNQCKKLLITFVIFSATSFIMLLVEIQFGRTYSGLRVIM